MTQSEKSFVSLVISGLKSKLSELDPDERLSKENETLQAHLAEAAAQLQGVLGERDALRVQLGEAATVVHNQTEVIRRLTEGNQRLFNDNVRLLNQAKPDSATNTFPEPFLETIAVIGVNEPDRLFGFTAVSDIGANGEGERFEIKASDLFARARENSPDAMRFLRVVFNSTMENINWHEKLRAYTWSKPEDSPRVSQVIVANDTSE